MHKVFPVVIAMLCFTTMAIAQVSPSQQSSGLESMRLLQDRDFTLRDQLRKKRTEVAVPVIEEISTEDLPETQKVLINNIVVNNVTLISQKEIKVITDPFIGKKLSLREMQQIANLITDAYRQKGFITSRAVLPPQKIKDNELIINVVEGKTGDITIRGNKYFKTSTIQRRLMIRPNEAFDYTDLQHNLDIINEHPDRNVSAVLAPGKEQGTTDIILNVEEELPIHVGFTYDNYLSRFLDKDRYEGYILHNNLLGFDDRLTFRYQLANSERYRLNTIEYLFPVNNKLELGFYATRTKSEIGESLSNLKARGKSEIYSLFAKYRLIEEDFTYLDFTAGFDSKDVFNFVSGSELSRDRLRNAKFAFNYDRLDLQGRWIVANELSLGIDDILGGNQAVDSRSSRTGSGADFVKSVVDVVRLQDLFWEMTILLKGQAQLSSRILPATEEYQVGGIANVRGYAPGEISGDEGQSFTAELTVPAYFIPKDMKVPFAQGIRLYDTLKFAAFYDFGRVTSENATLAGTEDSTRLRSVGTGVRMIFPQDLIVRVDVAWPLDRTPSDDNHVHTWLRVSKEF